MTETNPNNPFGNPAAGRVYSTVTRTFTVARAQPSWITRAALTAFAITFVVIVVLLLIPALLIGIAVFLLLMLWRTITSPFRKWAIRRETAAGRKNVRVLPRR